MYDRRPLLRPQVLTALAQALASAKADLHQQHFRHCCELADLRQELNELRSVVADVTATLREKADADTSQLRRELARQLVAPT